ncbi:MAG: PRC-barrel domain-containing protein [Pseudolabrys sp.]
MPSSSAMTTNATKPGTFVQQQQATQWRTSKLVGADVYGSDNSKIGDINDVLIGSSGSVQAVVVGVGGFLGVGEKNVAIPFDALNISRKANCASIDKITVSYSKDDLKNAPKFAWYQSNETTGSSTMSTAPGRKTSTGPMNSTTTPTNNNTMKK